CRCRPSDWPTLPNGPLIGSMWAMRMVSLALAVVLLSISPSGNAAETIRIAHIDPISGPFGNVGQSLGRHLQAVVDDINAKGGAFGGAKFELINLDNKSSPTDSVL